jgi:hypothetical protein
LPPRRSREGVSSIESGVPGSFVASCSSLASLRSCSSVSKCNAISLVAQPGSYPNVGRVDGMSWSEEKPRNCRPPPQRRNGDSHSTRPGLGQPDEGEEEPPLGARLHPRGA